MSTLLALQNNTTVVEQTQYAGYGGGEATAIKSQELRTMHGEQGYAIHES